MFAEEITASVRSHAREDEEQVNIGLTSLQVGVDLQRCFLYIGRVKEACTDSIVFGCRQVINVKEVVAEGEVQEDR
ncbi:MAG: hypothetical protein M3Z66_11115 [Chloroflexota bacterium]|nr:hypothetical protein [Chloroflexota bacterium]